MRVGVDYYPEQCDRALWETDAEAMVKAGVKLIRIGEFGWQRVEPNEGKFDFDWLRDAIKIFARHGIGTILTLPTSNPPKWLLKKHGDIMRKGRINPRSGKNMHWCINSPLFTDYSRKLTEKLAVEFGNNPAVVSWQIDYEYEAYSCTCEACRAKFSEWLWNKYGSTDGINRALDSEYYDISQIEPSEAFSGDWQKPSLSLEWYRFKSDSAAEYVRDKITVIRAVNNNATITTNISQHKFNPDFYRMAECLDYVTFDNFPSVRTTGDLTSSAFELDMMRGIKNGGFMAINQPDGLNAIKGKMTLTPAAGMTKGSAMQALLRGANTVFLHCWRNASNGLGMYNRGLFDRNNQPTRGFKEFTDLCSCVSDLSMLTNTSIVSEAAIIYSPEADASLRMQPETEGFDYIEQIKLFHSVLTGYGANVDIVSPEAELSGYKLVIAPSLYVNKESIIGNIYKYTMNGGTIVLTARTGVRDERNNYIREKLPAAYGDLVGAVISDSEVIGNEKRRIRDFAGNIYECGQWCDILNPQTARAYAVYDGEDGAAAVTMNKYCSGVAYYVGTICEMGFYKSFISNLMMQTGIRKLIGLAEGMEVVTRSDSRDEYICFFNNSRTAQELPLPKPMYSLISKEETDLVQLRPYETEIVRK